LSVALAENETAVAKRQYEAAARTFFEATLSVLRQLRPGCRLGWYVKGLHGILLHCVLSPFFHDFMLSDFLASLAAI
jgi:hypothetical protein